MQIQAGGGVSPQTLDALRARMLGKAAGPAGFAAGSVTRATLESAFTSIDTDRDGRLSAAELGAALRAGGHRQHRATPAESDGRGGIGSALAAQFLGQGQAVPGTGTTGATDAGSVSAGRARQLLAGYAFAQVGAMLPGDASLSA